MDHCWQITPPATRQLLPKVSVQRFAAKCGDSFHLETEVGHVLCDATEDVAPGVKKVMPKKLGGTPSNLPTP
jgi:hypothetical protein